MSRLTFDARAHIYRWGSRIVPSVTGVLKGAGYYRYDGISPRVLERARRRGKAVHEVIDGHITHGSALTHPDPDIDWCVREFGRALELLGFVPIDSELRLIDERRRCAGTLDQLGRIFGRDWAVLDVKVMDRVDIDSLELQTAKYASMVEQTFDIRVHRRIGVQLYPRKRFRTHPLSDPLAATRFEGLLDTYHDTIGGPAHA